MPRVSPVRSSLLGSALDVSVARLAWLAARFESALPREIELPPGAYVVEVRVADEIVPRARVAFELASEPVALALP
jgi:hypothetical protein